MDTFDTSTCSATASLLDCGGMGKLNHFLTANGGAFGMQAYYVALASIGAVMQLLQLVCVRLAASRSGDWERSRRCLALSWILPFGWLYFQFCFPLERMYGADYEDRSDHVVMMPIVSGDPESRLFDMCTGLNMCAHTIDIMEGINQEIASLFKQKPEARPFNGQVNLWKERLEDSSALYKYQSQTKAGPIAEGIVIYDSGAFKVGHMIDVLDYMVALFLGVNPGAISETAEFLLANLARSLQALVRSDTTFKCFLTLAPLALSVLPALTKGAVTAKLIFPQDPMIGWIIRAVPLLKVPLHAILILVIGQIFSDWYICGACVCFIIGDTALTIFGADIVESYATFEGPKMAIKRAKLKGLLFHIAGSILLVVFLATNDILGDIMPDISLKVSVSAESVLKLLKMIFIFIAKFIVSKTLVQILFCDFIMTIVFRVTHELQNQSLQLPFQREAGMADIFMRRTRLDGESSPGCCMDCLGVTKPFPAPDPNANYAGALAKTEFDMKRAREIFQTCDADNSGSLDETELEGLLKLLGYPITDPELAKMMSYMDVNGDGKVTREEFNKYFEGSVEVFVIHPDNTRNVIMMPPIDAVMRATSIDFQELRKYPKRKEQYLPPLHSYCNCGTDSARCQLHVFWDRHCSSEQVHIVRPGQRTSLHPTCI